MNLSASDWFVSARGRDLTNRTRHSLPEIAPAAGGGACPNVISGVDSEQLTSFSH